jgi:hypothetical protein
LVDPTYFVSFAQGVAGLNRRAGARAMKVDDYRDLFQLSCAALRTCKTDRSAATVMRSIAYGLFPESAP